MTDHVDPLVGTTIGRFKIERLIGKGGMGRVYLGVQPAIGSRVAIKVLAQECADSPELLERFFTEARAVNLIKHENIIDIIDLDRLPDGRPFIVMEFVEGKTLREIVPVGMPLPLGGTIYAMLDVLFALDAAHVVGIVHRDLKPDNVIVSPGGHAKVLDFGIAKLVGEGGNRTATGIALGTPHYMAPEQILQGSCDARVDVYAAGVMLYELLAGRRPFDATSDFALMEAQLRSPPPPLPKDLPRPIAAVIERALAKAPADRYDTARDMAIALRDAAAAIDPALLAGFEDGVVLPVPPAIGATRRPAGAKAASSSSSEAPTSAERRRRDAIAETRPSVAKSDTADPGSSLAMAAEPASESRPREVAGGRRTRFAIIALAFVVVILGSMVTVLILRRNAVATPPSDASIRTVDAPVQVDANLADAVEIDAPPAADASLVDALLHPDAHVIVAATRSPASGTACAYSSDCPYYQCQCAHGVHPNLQNCDLDEHKCWTGADGCPAVCRQAKVAYLGWELVYPRTESDCVHSALCTRDHKCKVRNWQESAVDLRCVESCRETNICQVYGKCAEPTDGGVNCTIQTNADCAASSLCKDNGTCVASHGTCITDNASCRASSVCALYGQCTATAKADACEATSDADCLASSQCPSYGRCKRVGGSCKATTDAMCQKASQCHIDGLCTSNGDHCVATTESCKASDACMRKTECRLRDGRCVR